MANYSWSGTWTSNTYYEVNTFVKYENIAYVSTNSFQGSTTPPPLDMSNWNVFVIGYQVPVTPTPTPTIPETPTPTPSVTTTVTNTPSHTPVGSPTNTPSVTETPTPTVTETPTGTPNETTTPTPTVTETPTGTPSETTTPTPTITPTPTVTPPPIFVPTCSLIFNSDTGGIYSYNSLTNTSTFLYDSGIISGDIATTQNKLWLYSSVIHEYDITLSPWSITFNRNISLSVTLGSGLGAINDTTLISTDSNTSEIITLDITTSARKSCFG